MSTGFHQLVPIVMQAGLLHRNEIMAVENPESHLHPSLQIKVAEFLMHQANAGKVMLIETHSDLFVRRVLRAIREEQISPGNVLKQSAVGISFTCLVDHPKGFKHAEFGNLEINEKGQVHNWPSGFMDDDLKEADRWLQANFHSGIRAPSVSFASSRKITTCGYCRFRGETRNHPFHAHPVQAAVRDNEGKFRLAGSL